MTFALFIFLFPFTAFTLIEKNIKNQKGNIDFAKYNIDLLNEYKQLGIGAKDKDTMGANQISSTINLISDFLRFNFLHIYDAHKDMGGAESIQGIRDLIKKQLDLCSKSEIRIQALIDKL